MSLLYSEPSDGWLPEPQNKRSFYNCLEGNTLPPTLTIISVTSYPTTSPDAHHGAFWGSAILKQACSPPLLVPLYLPVSLQGIFFPRIAAWITRSLICFTPLLKSISRPRALPCSPCLKSQLAYPPLLSVALPSLHFLLSIYHYLA